MKKYIILLIILIIFGCKNINKINLLFYYEDSENIESFLNEKTEDFIKKNPNIIINKVEKNKDELLNDLKLDKIKIDFIRYPSCYLNEFVEKNIIKSSNQTFKIDFLNQFQLKALQTVSINKQVWGIPVNFINYPLLYYNKLLINNPPKNTNELIKIFNQLRNKKYINSNILINLNEPFFIYPWLNSTGADLFNENKAPILNSKEIIKALQFIYDLKYYYKIIKSDFNQNELEQNILNNNISMIIDGDWTFNYYQKIFGEKFGVSSVPLINDKNPNDCIIISTVCYSVIKGAGGKKLNAVKEFIKFMSSYEIENQLIKHGKLPTLKIFESQIPDEPLINNFWNLLKTGKACSSGIYKKMNLLNKALRPQLEELIDEKISPISAAQNAQEYLEKIYIEINKK